MSQGHVFAGIVRWPGGGQLTAPPDTLGGVFRMAVGGGEWEHMTRGLPEECHVPCLTVDPHDGNRIYAGTQDGPYASTDAGTSWTRLAFPHRDRQVWSIAVHPRNPQKIYVGTSPLGIFISEDGGGTWREAKGAVLPDAMEMGSFRNRVMRFAFNPARPEQEHLKSAILTKHTAEGMLDVHAVAVSAAAPETPILALRMGLFRSEDHGAHWLDYEMRKLSPIFYGRDVRISPHDPKVVYATLSTAASGETGTVWRSPDLGRSWARFDPPTRAASTMMAVVPSPRDAAVVYAAARKGQVFGTVDGGATWRETPLPKGCMGVMALAVN